MAHPEQREFCISVRNKFPSYFHNKSVLDVGSLDINGNNRYLFNDCSYIGNDIGSGKNVDLVIPIHKFYPFYLYDVVISTEMLEHDQYYFLSLKAMLRILKSPGLLIITAATKGRPEHGTINFKPEDSPYTNHYYRNITKKMLNDGLDFEKNFTEWKCIINHKACDIYFWGIKLL